MRPFSPSPVQIRAEQRRQRWFRGALGALIALVVVAVAATVWSIEHDLEDRAQAAVEADGEVGLRVAFSGQDATVTCGVPVDDPAAVVALVERVHGVRSARLDASCTGEGAPGVVAAPAATTTTVTSASPESSVEPTEASVAIVEPTPAPGDGPIVAQSPPVDPDDDEDEPGEGELSLAVEATLADGRVVFEGTVPDTATRDRLVDAAEQEVAATNVVDELVIDPDSAIGARDVETSLDGLTTLVGAMVEELVSGSVRLSRGDLSITGVYANAAGRAAVEAAAENTGAAVAITDREIATESDAEQLADLLNRLVSDDPILFEPNSAVLTDDAGAVLDRVAAVSERYGGVAIEVIGHTDSRGDALANLQLSRLRAEAVRDALIERGVTAPITFVGRGELEPVLVDGVEDIDASRRVEFEVETDDP